MDEWEGRDTNVEDEGRDRNVVETHRQFMNMAFKEAEEALKEEEVPVGCVIVKDGVCVAKAHNMTNALSDPLAHAELICIKMLVSKEMDANDEDDTMRGDSTNLKFYVTIEPCAMCAGVIERLGAQVVFGEYNEIFGSRKILGKKCGKRIGDKRGVKIFKRFYETPNMHRWLD